MASKFRYFCRKCGFQMNAMHRPVKCPLCRYVEPMKTKFEANLTVPQNMQQPAKGLQENIDPDKIRIVFENPNAGIWYGQSEDTK